MQKYTYNETRRELFRRSDAEIFKLCELSDKIYRMYSKGASAQKIAHSICELYDVDFKTANSDTHSTINQLKAMDVFAPSGANDSFVLDSSNWSVQTPIIHIIENCNSPCVGCDCWKQKKKSFHKLKDLMPLFDDLKRKGALSVMVSGGEPLLHPELREIVEYLNFIDLGIELNTNGILLYRHEWVHEFKIDHLVVSMDGHDRPTYKKYRGADAYDKVWKNIHEFSQRSKNTLVGIRVTVNRDTLFNLDKIIEISLKNGVKAIGFSPADIDSNSFARYNMDSKKEFSLMQSLIPTLDELYDLLGSFIPGHKIYQVLEESHASGLTTWGSERFIECIKHYIDIRENKKSDRSQKLCTFPLMSMVLDYNGDLRNCFYSKAFGNLYKYEKVDWDFKETIPDLLEQKKCSGCRGKIFCRQID